MALENLKESVPKLLVSILICNLTGILGSVLTMEAVPTWYESLNKPWFRPPSWVFAPAWTTLYTLMGISFFLVWREGFDTRKKKLAGILFALQLFLNGIWTPIFFGLKNILWAFVEILGLDIAVLATIYQFNKVSRKSALLLIPYGIWLGFATLLNYSILILN